MARRHEGYGATLEQRTGSEGPRHDPYGYTEWVFYSTTGVRTVLHCGGLLEWSETNSVRVDRTGIEAVKAFEKATGLRVERLPAIWERIHYRCRNCGCMETRSLDGYPGESVNVCVRCGKIVSVDFNRSAIE